MKKILIASLFSSLVFIYACNDAGTSGEGTAGDDTSTAMSDNSGSMANSVMTKNGLPLGPDQEVPTNNSSGKGTADVTYNKETKMLSYTVNYEGLTAAPTMAHIHGTAPRGSNAGVVHDLSSKLQKQQSGSFSDSVMIEGKLKEDSLLNGFYYFNIHTPKNPGGEIRGQIEF